MKILISERQLKTITEQWWNDPKHPEYKKYAPTDYEKRETQKINNQIAGQDKLGKVVKKLGPNLDADDYTDIVSGLLDVIPGIGNIASGGIDITHGVSYIVRYFYAKTFEDKAEMAVMGLLTLGMAFIPVGGNAANIAVRGELKMLMKKTPYEVLQLAKKMGLVKKIGFNLSKESWKYSVMVALKNVFRGSIDNIVGEVTRKLAFIANKSEELRPILQNYITTINEFKGIETA